jgi:hypothetical protein
LSAPSLHTYTCIHTSFPCIQWLQNGLLTSGTSGTSEESEESESFKTLITNPSPLQHFPSETIPPPISPIQTPIMSSTDSHSTEPSPPPPPPPPRADPTPPPTKRRKTQLACHSCRDRKIGCDGHRPHCSSCVMRGWQDRCSYQEKEIPSFLSTPAPSVLLIWILPHMNIPVVVKLGLS